MAKHKKSYDDDDGRVIAMGTHNELYASCADYRKMVDLQKLEEEGGEQNA